MASAPVALRKRHAVVELSDTPSVVPGELLPRLLTTHIRMRQHQLLKQRIQVTTSHTLLLNVHLFSPGDLFGQTSILIGYLSWDHDFLALFARPSSSLAQWTLWERDMCWLSAWAFKRSVLLRLHPPPGRLGFPDCQSCATSFSLDSGIPGAQKERQLCVPGMSCKLL